MKAENLKVLTATVVFLLSVIMTQCTPEEEVLPTFENQGSIGPGGGIVKMTDGASVEIPVGALGSAQTITVENTTSLVVVANTGCRIYDFTPDGLTFTDSLIIRLPFDDTYVDHESADDNYDVYIMVFQDSVWERLKTEVDLNTRTASARTVHFSKYGIFFPSFWTSYFKSNKNNSSRILAVPYYNQGETDWCALYSLNMITKYAGYDFKAPGFAAILDKSESQALSLYEEWYLRPLFTMLNLRAEVSFPGWSNMEELCGYLIYNLDQGFPVMLGSLNHDHVIVITGYDQSGFYINDPSGAMLARLKPEVQNDELTMFHVGYDNFLDLMNYGKYNNATTFVIKEPGNVQESGLSLNFIPGWQQILVLDNENNVTGTLDFSAEKYQQTGYSIINHTDSTNLLHRDGRIQISGVLANSNIGQDMTARFRILIDNEEIPDGSQLVTVPGNNALFITELKSCQLSYLAGGSHILRVEIISTQTSDVVLDYWEFPFRLNYEWVTDPACDDFESGINTAAWTATSGDWDIQSGELHGYWDWGAAHADQAIIMLSEELYNSNSFTATAYVKVRTGSEICGERFALRSSAGNQILIDFNWELGIVAAEYRTDGSMYTQLNTVKGYDGFKTTVGEVNEYKVVKNGTLITVFVNNTEIFHFEDIYFNGNTKLGLGAYGNAYYERICVR